MSDTTRQVLADMLRENTGRHFLDSGSAYGRNWERNQLADFEAQPATTYDARVYHSEQRGNELEFSVTHNVYHWLAERLTFNARLQRMLDFYASHRPDDGWLQIMEGFATLLQTRERKRGREFGGIYKDGDYMTVNTYNGEDCLSQTLQYVYFDSERYGEVILLQIHGGCDVRGGYTAPKAFDCSIDDQSILDNARAVAQCSRNREHYWTSDDGCHFYDQGACGRDYRELRDYDCIDVEYAAELVSVPSVDPAQGTLPDVPRTEPTLDYVQVCDRKAYCPKCGAELEAFTY